ncbi:putative glycosyl transferase [Phaeobacter sp. CECT 5382]|uniref:polysaccharide deacetylase family protein n=1 Tax=Phaeobacter sp. CECT 5382 TaxID=1712645 RepID=UPI0006DBD4BD|nr:polysaccharide deacetylase family protein [Phaeobacter sp. CECT 5382]CUH88936.1 putative glycosyl transferase [Phaeobacter sp. CECT 5382]
MTQDTQQIDWSSLDLELTAWQDAGLTLPLWWRDDDAIAPTGALDQLSALSRKLGLPVHLAVIPKEATLSLAQYVQQHPELIPVVHGWAHQNQAPEGEKKCEFAAQRPVEDSLAEIEQGLASLSVLFGDALLPIFVPPWNRIAPTLLPWMAGVGYTALSTFTPRRLAKAAPGLEQINTHLDPIDWKGSRSLVPPARLIAQVSDQLRDRRLGRANNAEPYGILTHHLVHDPAIWQFTEALVARLIQGPGQVWKFDTRKI